MTSRRERYEQRHSALRSARSSWEPTWRDIAEQILPYRVIWDRADRNRGDRKESKIMNNTPVRAVQTLAAGMMAGITSPARQWYGLTTVDPELAKWKRVKAWLDQAEERSNALFVGSSWYPSLANGTYLDLGGFGTHALAHEEDGVGGLRYVPLPLGEYCLDANHAGRVDTCYRDLDMSVRQLVQKFGLKACSQTVRNAWDRGNYETPVPVIHAIQPNDEYEQGYSGRHGMRFASCWWEPGSTPGNVFLREAGYEEFPIHAPRWSVRPGDVYGRGPGWSARGDCRVLQLHEKSKLELLDKIRLPPMKMSDDVRNPSLLPGDKTYMPAGGSGVFEPSIDVAPLAAALREVKDHISDVEYRIGQTFYVDLWQTFLMDERNERATATEIEAKREERMLMLGPLLENLNDGLLEPAVQRTVNIAIRTDQLPPLPPELQGQDLKVKFVSVMHEAQQIPKLAGIRTLVAETASLGQIRADAFDKLNADVIVDELVNITGVRSDAVLSKDEVEALRRAKAEQAKARESGEAMLAATQGARNLSSVDPQKISDIAGVLPPVAAAQGGALGPVTP